MPTTSQMQSISGIINQIRTTSGAIPPPLVGASVTLVGDQVFVFAGRLVSSRKMINHMHVLDLKTLEWTRHIPPPDSAKPPKPRYFHSASVYNNSIVFFGGMGYSRVSTDGLCVLDDIAVFDIDTMSWIRPEVKPSLFAPRSRYAHLSSITEDKLIIVGGQDMNNNYLGEANILDLKTWEWIQVQTIDKHVGAYRSVLVTTPAAPSLPFMMKDSAGEEPLDMDGDGTASRDGQTSSESGTNTPRPPSTKPNGQRMLNAQEPNPVYLYSNYNFADVKRELQLIYASSLSSFVIEDCSSFMTGSVMPPGLRFPTGHTLGHQLILAGTYLSPQNQAYTIWSLNLGTLIWSRIETGSTFTSGSWNRGVLHENTNRFLVFGNRTRNLLEDYNHRQVNFEHFASVDLEAFGVYRLPKTTCSSLAQEMGLSLLNEPAVSDFRIVTRENQVINVNSSVLCQRWPYFAELMEKNRKQLTPEPKQQDLPEEEPSEAPSEAPAEQPNTDAETEPAPSQTTVKSRSMLFPYPHAVVIALLQYIYTDNLLTAQQYQPHILAQLLLLADMYNLTRLRELSTHALHQMLNMSTAPLIFETAALTHQTSLQIRALKMMIAAKKMIQQQQQQVRQPTNVSPRQRTPSTPAIESSNMSTTSSASSFGMNNTPSSIHSPVLSSRLTLASSISRQSSPFDSHATLQEQPNEGSGNATSPTLSAYRSRTASITNKTGFSNAPRSSTSSTINKSVSMPSWIKTSSNYSPSSTPQTSMSVSELLPKIDQEEMGIASQSVTNVSVLDSPSTPTKPKEKSRKKFLEAFGSKLSMF